MKVVNQRKNNACTIIQMAGTFNMLMEDWTMPGKTGKKTKPLRLENTWEERQK